MINVFCKEKDGIRDIVRSRGLEDMNKRQVRQRQKKKKKRKKRKKKSFPELQLSKSLTFQEVVGSSMKIKLNQKKLRKKEIINNTK